MSETAALPLPESWQTKVTPEVPRVAIPDRETNSYEELCAWYSGFSFCEHYRKVVQANCQEIVRARHVGEKITEARIEALARLEPAYLNYLEKHLYGRKLWEKAFLAQGGLR